jgi:hypothetical protein
MMKRIRFHQMAEKIWVATSDTNRKTLVGYQNDAEEKDNLRRKSILF